MSPFSEQQTLNDWVQMLHGLFGLSQNYSKSIYEIHSHLSEVCGAFGKHLFKKNDQRAAAEFLPKIFAWAVALLKAVRPEERDLEGIVLRKFPGVCSYCGENPCSCWDRQKPALNPAKLSELFYRNAGSLRRSPNDFQLMFQSIYGSTWIDSSLTSAPLRDRLRQIFARMIEELAEMAEAIRFHHLYPRNFENELADFLAWWFALVSCYSIDGGSEAMLVGEMLWQAYPGRCTYCNLYPCFCRPGPVRELMSKPAPGEDHRFDALTSLYNQGAYQEDLAAIEGGTLLAALPIGCVRLDIDKFKSVNDAYGHAAGDSVLKHLADVLRSKARERDRLYRISGDEFGLLLMDTTVEEASGLMKRVHLALERGSIQWVTSDGTVVEIGTSVSVGVAECSEPRSIAKAFEQADALSYVSKKNGGGQVTVSSGE